MSKWTPAWLTCTKSAMSSSAWRNSCLVLLVRPHLTPCIRSGNPVTMRRSGAASKSVKLIAVKMSKAISRSRKHLATPVPCKCCRIQKNAFLQFSTLSGTSCSGNAFSNLVRVLETRARKLSRSSSSFAANPPWLPVTMTQPLGMQDPCPFAWQPHPFGLAIARPSASQLQPWPDQPKTAWRWMWLWPEQPKAIRGQGQELQQFRAQRHEKRK